MKKCLTRDCFHDKIVELLKKWHFQKEKKIKKLLTNEKAYDKIYELSPRQQQRTLKTEQYVKP